MFAGHYAPAYAIKSVAPEIPLWQLFLAVQAVDVLFFTFVPLGVEQLTIDPSRPGMLAMVLPYMPYSHSLAATLAYGVIIALLGRSRQSVWLGVAVASHWFLDFPMHVQDLPVAAGDGLRLGLGLWAWPFTAFLFEIGVLLAGYWLFWREAQRGRLLLGILVASQVVTSLLAPVPSSAGMLALVSLASYLGFTVLAWYTEPEPPAVAEAPLLEPLVHDSAEPEGQAPLS
jgi:hypothetical protein